MTRAATRPGRSLHPLLKAINERISRRFGIRAIAREARYPDPLVEEYGIDPVWLHLFELARP